MTSLTGLAASHAAAPAFNADFYVAAATVIPVLFLAIAVQGPTYTDLLKTARGAIKRRGESATAASRLAALAVILGSFGLAYFVLIAGVLGEIFALISLAVRKDNYQPLGTRLRCSPDHHRHPGASHRTHPALRGTLHLASGWP